MWVRPLKTRVLIPRNPQTVHMMGIHSLRCLAAVYLGTAHSRDGDLSSRRLGADACETPPCRTRRPSSSSRTLKRAASGMPMTSALGPTTLTPTTTAQARYQWRLMNAPTLAWPQITAQESRSRRLLSWVRRTCQTIVASGTTMRAPRNPTRGFALRALACKIGGEFSCSMSRTQFASNATATYGLRAAPQAKEIAPSAWPPRPVRGLQ